MVYLVPTTILAQQHYNTFVQRMKEFPVRVDLMCRFRTPAQQKKTIEEAKKAEGKMPEDGLLTAKNKWLIAHEEAEIEGAFNGLCGVNVTV